MTFPVAYRMQQLREAVQSARILMFGDSFNNGRLAGRLVDAGIPIGRIRGSGTAGASIIDATGGTVVQASAGDGNTYANSSDSTNLLCEEVWACTTQCEVQLAFNATFETGANGALLRFQTRQNNPAGAINNYARNDADGLRARLIYYADDALATLSNRDFDMLDHTTLRQTRNFHTHARRHWSKNEGNPDAGMLGTPHASLANAIYPDVDLIVNSGHVSGAAGRRLDIRDTLAAGSGSATAIDTDKYFPVISPYVYEIDSNGDPLAGPSITWFGGASYHWSNYYNASGSDGGAAWKNISYAHLLSVLDVMTTDRNQRPLIIANMDNEWGDGVGDKAYIYERVIRFRSVMRQVCAAIGTPEPLFWWWGQYNHEHVSFESDAAEGYARHVEWNEVLADVAQSYGDSFTSILALGEGYRLDGADAAKDYFARNGGKSFTWGPYCSATDLATAGDVLDPIHLTNNGESWFGKRLNYVVQTPDPAFDYVEIPIKATAIDAPLQDFRVHYDLANLPASVKSAFFAAVDAEGKMISIYRGAQKLPHDVIVPLDIDNQTGCISFLWTGTLSDAVDSYFRIYPRRGDNPALADLAGGRFASYRSTTKFAGGIDATAFPFGRPYRDFSQAEIDGAITAQASSDVVAAAIAGLPAFRNQIGANNYNEYVSLTAVPEDELPITMLALFRPGFVNIDQSVMSIGNTTSGNEHLALQVTSAGKLRAMHRMAAPATGATTTLGLTANNWYLGAAEFNAANRSVWLDGGDKTTETEAKTMLTPQNTTLMMTVRSTGTVWPSYGQIAWAEIHAGVIANADAFFRAMAQMYKTPATMFGTPVYVAAAEVLTTAEILAAIKADPELGTTGLIADAATAATSSASVQTSLASAATNGGMVVSYSPVSETGQISQPLVIGDDYKSTLANALAWNVPKLPGVDVGDAECYFGIKNSAGAGFIVTGAVSAVDSETWKLTFEIPKATWSTLTKGDYEWSAEVRDASGNEVTRVRNADYNYRVQLVEKQT